MKNSNIKKILIIGAIFIIIVLIELILIISKRHNDNSTDNNIISNNNTIVENKIINSDESKNIDYDLFFSLQQIIATFYSDISYNQDRALKKLSKNYVDLYNLNNDSIKGHFFNNYEEASFNLIRVTGKTENNIYYYYLEGISVGRTMNGQGEMLNNIEKFTIVVDKESNYIIIPNFDYNKVDYFDAKNKFVINKFSKEKIHLYHLYLFKALLKNDPLKAYNYLSEKSKTNYLNAKDFVEKKSTLYNDLSRKVNSYTNNDNGFTLYFDNNYKVQFIENGIMNFKIVIN